MDIFKFGLGVEVKDVGVGVSRTTARHQSGGDRPNPAYHRDPAQRK